MTNMTPSTTKVDHKHISGLWLFSPLQRRLDYALARKGDFEAAVIIAPAFRRDGPRLMVALGRIRKCEDLAKHGIARSSDGKHIEV